jgi:hypothetical protein
MTFAPIGGDVFHALFRDCLARGRSPTQAEIELIARKIWQDGFANEARIGWQDLPPGSEAYDHSIRAAQMAFGVYSPESVAA